MRAGKDDEERKGRGVKKGREEQRRKDLLGQR